jgi:hypothetical protein
VVGSHDDVERTPVQPFFERLFGQDPSGVSWLGPLLQATPLAGHRLGELAQQPGWLETPLAVRGTRGRLACFDYLAAPSPRLLRWYIDHPHELTWPEGEEGSEHSNRLRRALLYDDPPGSQVRAQERARDLLRTRSALSREWWRFEEVTTLDCVLITDRLVITVEAQAGPTLSAATPWYPKRPALARTTEAAKHIAQDRAWASLLLSDEPIEAARAPNFAHSLTHAAPHLDSDDRLDLANAYLGNLTWDAAREALGVEGLSLPERSAGPPRT